jgi:hypothetical protein
MMPGELRIPSKILSYALQAKQTKLLRLFASAKLQGHRSEIKPLCECLKIKPKTCQRLVKKLANDGLAGTDGKFLFPRGWEKLQLSKRRGLYLVEAPRDLKRFEAFCFAHALKRLLRRKADPKRPDRGRTMQSDLPTSFLHKSLGLSERRFERLKSSGQKYKFLTSVPQFRVIGKASEFDSIRKNLHGLPVLKRGKHTVVPEASKIRVLI